MAAMCVRNDWPRSHEGRILLEDSWMEIDLLVTFEIYDWRCKKNFSR